MATQVIDIKKMVNEINSEVITWRRHLHENPELSFEEIKTSQFVYDVLESFGNS